MINVIGGTVPIDQCGKLGDQRYMQAFFFIFFFFVCGGERIVTFSFLFFL